MFVDAMAVCGVAFAAYTVFILIMRIRRRMAARPVLPAWEPAFHPAQVQIMFESGQITLAERDRLLAALRKQRERKEAQTAPPGARGFPIAPTSPRAGSK